MKICFEKSKKKKNVILFGLILVICLVSSFEMVVATSYEFERFNETRGAHSSGSMSDTEIDDSNYIEFTCNKLKIGNTYYYKINIQFYPFDDDINPTDMYIQYEFVDAGGMDNLDVYALYSNPFKTQIVHLYSNGEHHLIGMHSDQTFDHITCKMYWDSPSSYSAKFRVSWLRIDDS